MKFSNAAYIEAYRKGVTPLPEWVCTFCNGRADNKACPVAGPDIFHAKAGK